MSGDCFCSPCIYRFIHSHFSVPHFTFMSITAIHNTTLVSKTKTLNASLKRYVTNNTWKWTTLLLLRCNCLLYLDYLSTFTFSILFAIQNKKLGISVCYTANTNKSKNLCKENKIFKASQAGQNIPTLTKCCLPLNVNSAVKLSALLLNCSSANCCQPLNHIQDIT